MRTPKQPTATTLPAAIYARISADKEGTERGVERQEADCRALAERLGIDVAKVYVDNDISASGLSTKPRPAYERMLRDARAGHYGAVLAYSNSRLTRRPREFEDLLDLSRTGGVRISTVVSGEDDLSTADGRMVARYKSVADTAEAERIAERSQRAKAQAAAEGRYRGGKRPYGFERDGLTVREAEADVIRRATKDLLAGRSLRAVCRELNTEGLQPVRDKKRKDEAGRVVTDPTTGAVLRDAYPVEWNSILLRDVLLRARNAGLIAHGTANRKGFEVVGKATWPALVDEDEWRALVALLTRPERRTNNTASDNRWLGSYIYACGKCGAPMRVDSTAGPGSNRPSQAKRYHYRCTAAAHLQITQGRTDEFVRGVVADLVRDPRIVAALMPSEDGDAVTADHERRNVLTARLAQTEADYDEDLIDARTRKRKVETIATEMAEVDARLAARASQSVSSPVLSAPDPGQAFLDAPIDVQRAVLAAVVRVEVLPATKRGVWWSPDRLGLLPVGSEN